MIIKQRVKFIIMLILFFANPIEAQIKKSFGPYNLFEKHLVIKADSGQLIYTLPDSFLIKKSEKIIISDSLLSPELDYKIDYINGQITFLKQFAPETEFSISYRYFPFRLHKSYYNRKLIYQADSKKELRKVSSIAIPKKVIKHSSLRKNGSIVRGISIGTNQGLKVDSGLRMNISGKISNQVEVIAALTDQTTPIQPEGNTQTLNEIDKVFVQLKSDHFNATLGDYYLSFSGSEFGQYQRKLQGAMGTARFKDFNLTLSGAVSKGRYTTNYFLGQEGNQGPYQLKGERGQIDIIVLAGTEKVWIDGELMTRGENNDYIIEYSNGQITFTRHRLITADSRITVDFQYSDLKFQRNLYGVKSQSKFWDEKVKLGFRVIHEADNKDNPLDYTLSDENLTRLRAAGDNADSAYVSGIRYVGDKKGYYIKVDSAAALFYRYAGADSGDYNVSFSYVGPGKGEYKSIGFGKYKFVGANQGSYLPIIILAPAQSHDLADMALTFNVKEGLNISSEFAVSRFDHNTYSNIDDNDNTGLAYLTSLKYQPEKLRIRGLNLGNLVIKGKYRIVNSKFRYIDRTEEIEKSRKWDSEEVVTREEEIKEIKTNYQPVTGLAVAGGVGEISKGVSFHSKRWETQADVTFSKLPQLHYKLEKIESNNKLSSRTGNWIRQSGNTYYNFWKLRPFFSYLGEVKKEVFQDTTKSGFKYDELSSGLELTNFNRMSALASFSKRDDKIFQGDSFIPQSQAMTQKYRWKYAKGSNLSASAEYVHRDRQFTDPAQSNKKTDLGDVRINISPFKRALITNWHYQISNTQVAKKEKVYLKVPQGEGNYRFNDLTKEYEPYDLGDYVLRIRQTDEFVPVVELRASTRIQFKPKLFFKKREKKKWQKWLSALSTDTYVRIEEKTEEQDIWAIYRLDLAKFQQPGKTIFGSNSFRQDVFVFQNNRDFSVRLRFEKKQEVNYQFLDGGNEVDFMERSVRLIKRFSNQFSAQLDGNNRSRSYHYTTRSDKIVEANELALDFSYRPKQIIEFALKSKFALKKDTAIDPPTQAKEYSLLPRTSYSFRGKGKLRLELEWTQVNVEPKNRIVPYELVGINRTGTTMRWMIGLNYNISRYIRATISYNGRREPDRPDTIHIGRAEMRAYF